MELLRAVSEKIRKSLSLKFIIATSVVILMLQLIGSIFIQYHQRAKIQSDLDHRGKGLVQVLAGVSKEFIIGYNYQILEEIVNNLLIEEDIAAAAFYNADGGSLTTFPANTDTLDCRVYNADILYENDKIGSLKIYISTASIQQSLASLNLWLMALTAVMIFLIVTILFILFKRIVSNPLAALKDEAGRLEAGELNFITTTKQIDEIGELTFSFKSLADSLKQKALVAEQIAAGNLEVEIEQASAEDVLGQAMLSMKSSLSGMQHNLQRTIDEQRAGNMDARCNPKQFSGAYQQLLEGVNNSLDAIQHPMLEAIQIMHEYAEGDFEQELRRLPGQQIILTEGLNSIRNNLLDVISGMDRMYQAQKAGDIEYFLEYDNFKGAFRDVAIGYNEAVKLHVDNMLLILNLLTEYADGQFGRQLPTLPGKQKVANEIMEKLRQNLMALVEQMKYLVSHALEGDLSVRANDAIFEGGYKEVVNGVNQTITAMTEPVNEAIRCLEQVATGDLTVRIINDYKGDHAKMKTAFNSTFNVLNGILSQVHSTITQINIGVAQVSDTGMAVSQGATQQASSLEEITSSLTEVGSQSRLNTENAAQSKNYAAVARKSADDGNQQMNMMLTAMAGISESSKHISKIIKVIDEIAFQTNLLALNAAVEAARAGVHGRGFAVVAEEVRNLAMRSAKAAKETSDLIEDSTTRVNNGSRIANLTAQSLVEIISNVSTISDIISEISTASTEQMQALDQINQGLTEISNVTQSNAASAETSASAAAELSNETLQLKEMIEQLKLSRVDSSASEEKSREFDRKAHKDISVNLMKSTPSAHQRNSARRRNKSTADAAPGDSSDFGVLH
jgi:methyl-accepting chemotaxis protein